MSVPPPAAHLLAGGDESAPLAVFVHGFEDDWRTWNRLARCLASGWRAVALDLPWRAGNDYRWRWMAAPWEWVAAGLDALGEVPTVLVGHSFGANAVLGALAAASRNGGAAASRNGGAARAAVLAAPFYRPPDAPVTWRTFERSRATFERQIADGMRLRLGNRAGPLSPALFEAMLAKACERIGPTGFLAVFDLYVASGHLPLATVGVPALILAGERDPGASMRHLDLLVDRLPAGVMSCGPDHDHFSHITRATEVAGLIDRFVAEAVAGPACVRPGGA
jgi:pimeloyl-ACP methyl ester carboxylesterase